MEIWKPVKGYENFYEVSDTGRIRSLDRTIVFKDGRKSFRQLDMDGNLIRVWNGFKKMQRETGFERKSVYECCIGKRESYKGYRWEYAEVV